MLRRSGIARAVRDLGSRVRVQESSKTGPPGLWLWSYLYGHTYQGGGFLGWKFDGMTENFGHGRVWTPNNITWANYKTTPEGGPYIDLNGSDEYLSDSATRWSAPGAHSFLLTSVFYPEALSSNQIASIWQWSINQRSFSLGYNTGVLSGRLSPDGVTFATVTSSLVPVTGAWHFAALFFDPSTQLALWHARTDAEELTKDINTTSIGTEVYASAVGPEIGSENNGTALWNGGLAPISIRYNIPATEIDEYVYGQFDLVRDAYWTYP